MKRTYFYALFTGIILSAALGISACAGETNYPFSSYLDHPVGDKIAAYLEDTFLTETPRTAESMRSALAEAGLQLTTEEELSAILGEAAAPIFGDDRNYFYTERTFKAQNGQEIVSPAVYVYGTGEDLRFTEYIRGETDGTTWDSFDCSVYDVLSFQFLPAENGTGYECIARSDFAFAEVIYAEHGVEYNGQSSDPVTTYTRLTFTQFAPYFDDAVTPVLAERDIEPDMRLSETDIILGGVEIGTVPLSRGRE